MTGLIIHLLFLLASSDHDERTNEIYERIKHGDKKAFRSFYDSHHKELYYFLLKKNTDTQTAEDLIQQAFVYIWENRHKIDETQSLRAYLFRIAYSRLLNSIRDNKKFDNNVEIPEQEVVRNPETDAEQKELKAQIDRAISSMPDKRQQAFRLCFIQKFTYKEAADIMEITEKTIENHMGMALKDLRKALSSVSKDFL